MAYVQEKKRKTGMRYRMFWRSPDPATGKLRLRSRDYKGSGGKSAALKEARLLEAADTRRPITREGNGTIAEFLAAWEATATNGLEPASKYNTNYHIRKINLWIGDQPLENFSALTLVNVQRSAANSGLEPVTVRKIMRTFKKALRSAIAWQLLPSDALALLETTEVIRVKKKTPALRTIEESEQLAAALRPKSPTIADMIVLAAYTGMRYGEIAALHSDQVDFKSKKLTVDRTAAKDKDLSFAVKLSPKTEAGNRTIPLSPEAMEVLRRRPNGEMFLSERGKIIASATASYHVRKAAQDLNIPHGFHNSRHFWASLMIDRGVPLPTVSKLLGHSSVRVTMEEYAWCISDPSDSDAVLAALGEASGKTPDETVTSFRQKRN